MPGDRPDQIDGVIVEEQERRVQACKDDVLVISRVGDHRHARRLTGKIFEASAGFHAEPGAVQRFV